MTDGSTARGWVEDPTTFAAALDDLKSEGCLLLVLEAGGSDAGGAGCRRLLGGDALDERKRVYVRSDRDSHATSSAASGDGSGERTVVYRSTARDAAAPAPAPSPGASSVASSVDALGDAVETEVDALAPLSGYEPGQLRVCVDALGALLDDDDLLTVLQFTKTVGAAVRDRDGIAHVHVGQHVPGIAVEGLLGQFDAVVEAGGDDDPRQRWHLPDESLSTEWLEL